MLKKTLIIGLGLIGGSFAKAIQNKKITQEIFAFDTDLESLENAENEGVINGICEIENLEDFDFVVIATPISSYKAIFAQLENSGLSDDALIIDLGSVKNFIAGILPKSLKNNFVSCHPIAGSELSGFENSSGDLFADKKFVICAHEKNKFVEKAEAIALKIGFNIELMTSQKHDEIYALTSHLPQFLSFLTTEFSPKNIKDNFFKAAFRLDESSPDIWKDIFKFNEKNLEKFYLKFFDELMKCKSDVKKYVVTPYSESSNADLDFDKKFFEENFAELFFRALVVKSYLEIKEVKLYQNYTGSGFKDFTSIIKILDYDAQLLQSLVSKHNTKLLQFFDSIS